MAKKELKSLGLDVGSHSIKAVELTKIDGVIELSNFVIEPLPLGELGEKDKERKENNEVLVEHLVKLKERLKVKADEVISAVSGQSVIVRYIEMPRIPADELANAIRFEAEQHIPYSVEDLIMDFQVLEGAQQMDPKRMKVLLVGVKRDLIDKHISTMERAGFQLTAIDVDSFAVINAFERSSVQPTSQGEMAKTKNIEGEKGESTALVNMGAKITNINVVKDKVSYFTRDIFIGGNDYTNSICREGKLGFVQAEDMKKAGDPDGSTRLSEMILPVLEEIAGEIRLSLDYYENQTHGERVAKILLSGGGSLLKDTDKLLSEKLEIPVEVWSPIEGLERISENVDRSALSEVSPVFAVGVGLALRGVSE